MMSMPFLDRLRVQLQVDEPNVAEVALTIALAEYPNLNIDYYMQQLDELAAKVRLYVSPQQSMIEQLYYLNHVLFQEEGFTGNQEDYYNPCNSFLNDVLDTRSGIPITLSIIYLEVGQRLGLPLEGVSFPGHFLVKLPVGEGEIILDPFLKGASLDETELLSRLRQNYGQNVNSELLIFLLEGASFSDILVRLLRNLKAIYLQNKEYEKVLVILSQMLIVEPELSEAWRDRGLLHEQLECLHSAQYDLQQYLQRNPKAEDADLMRLRLSALQAQAAYLH